MDAENQPKLIVNVDLDDRSFLFPEGKPLTQLRIIAYPSVIVFEGAFSFNRTKTAPTLFELDLDDALEFSHKLVEAVYRAQSGHLFSDQIRLSVHVVVNGYILQIGDMSDPKEIYIGTASIWRICKGLLQAIDHVRPTQSH